MCDEDDSNESPSKYQKNEKIIMEKSSIMQELDDLRELNVEVSPLPPSPLPNMEDGGPRVVVSTAAFHARVRGSVPGLSGLKETKNVSFPSTCESQYYGEPPWPRSSVLGLRPPGLKFRILCLEGSVISIISSSSGGSPGPV